MITEKKITILPVTTFKIYKVSEFSNLQIYTLEPFFAPKEFLTHIYMKEWHQLLPAILYHQVEQSTVLATSPACLFLHLLLPTQMHFPKLEQFGYFYIIFPQKFLILLNLQVQSCITNYNWCIQWNETRTWKPQTTSIETYNRYMHNILCFRNVSYSCKSTWSFWD